MKRALLILLCGWLISDARANPPLGLPQLAREPANPGQVELGRRLFFEQRLSADGTLACATCHIPEQGFTQNGPKTPVGIDGALVLRNTPSLYNVAYVRRLFHDGREADLEEQIWSPLLASNEMGNASRASVVQRIGGLAGYPEQFHAAFGDASTGIEAAQIGSALAAYQRTLLAAGSAFDHWFFAGQSAALSADAKRGFTLFVTSGCAACHTIATGYALFSDGDFHNTGIGYRAARKDRGRKDHGREEVTHNPADRWRYRTPTLRNVALTAPYMHDGSLATLAAVVAYYAAGGTPHPGQSPLMQPLELAPHEHNQLVAFLRALTAVKVTELAHGATPKREASSRISNSLIRK